MSASPRLRSVRHALPSRVRPHRGLRRALAAAVAIGLLAGCAAGGAGSVPGKTAAGAFERRLATEYRALATAAGAAGDPAAAAGYAARAEAAAAGRPAPPVPVPRLAGDDAEFEALIAARRRLAALLSGGAAADAPAAAAVALAGWDCWAARAARRASIRMRTADGVEAGCRRRHEAAMQRLTAGPTAAPARAAGAQGFRTEPGDGRQAVRGKK